LHSSAALGWRFVARTAMVAAHSVVVSGRSGAPGHVLPAADEKRRVGGIEVSFYNALGCGRCLVSDSDCRRAVTRGDRKSISTVSDSCGQPKNDLVPGLSRSSFNGRGRHGPGLGAEVGAAARIGPKKMEKFGPRIAHRKKYSRGSAPTGDRRGG
jgi:hypothetical protein